MGSAAGVIFFFFFDVPQPFWFSYRERWVAFVFARALDEEFLLPVSSISDTAGEDLCFLKNLILVT